MKKIFYAAVLTAILTLPSCAEKVKSEEILEDAEIISIEPTSGRAYDEIVVTGRNFAKDVRNNRILIGEKEVIPYEISEESDGSFKLYAEVPVRLGSGKVGVKVNDRSFISDLSFEYIRTMTFSNVIAAVWGVSWGNSDPTEAKFDGPIGACATSDGKILLAEQWTHCIRQINPSGSAVSLYAGVYKSAGEQSGALETAKFDTPKGIIAAGEGKYVVFSDKQVQLINGTTVSLIGKTRDADGETLYEGKISQVRFCNTAGAAYDAASKAVYFACTDTDEGRGTNRHYILKWDMETDAVSVAAGNAKSDTDSQATVDGAALTVARLDQPSRMCVASDGTLYFLQSAGNGGSCVRSLKDGVVKTVAGCPGTPAYADGKGGDARFSFVAEGGEPGGGIVEDEDGNLLIADPGNHAIRKMTPEGQVTTISAMGEGGPNKWAYKDDYDPAIGNKLGASQYVAHPMSIFRLEPYTYCFTQYTGDAPGVRKIVFE